MLVSSLSHSSTLMMEAICSSETLLTFTGLHGAISQKIELFLVPQRKGLLEKQKIHTTD
jgi:hypothetical protein